MNYNANSLSSKKIYCAICHNIIYCFDGTYQSSEFYSIICPNCVQRFSIDDIDLIIFLFYLYGGYYGEKKENNFSLEKLIITFINSIQQETDEIDFEDINKKAMHQALLHGISPAKYIQMLKSFLK